MFGVDALANHHVLILSSKELQTEKMAKKEYKNIKVYLMSARLELATYSAMNCNAIL